MIELNIHVIVLSRNRIMSDHKTFELNSHLSVLSLGSHQIMVDGRLRVGPQHPTITSETLRRERRNSVGEACPEAVG
jgi:hypothetical protein